MFAPGQDLRLYLSAGRGFETPTFNELGYRADGGAGLALDLRPAVSRNLELGVGLVAGFGIVLLAIILDRVTKASLARIDVSRDGR